MYAVTFFAMVMAPPVKSGYAEAFASSHAICHSADDWKKTVSCLLSRNAAYCLNPD
jgi:hypothetical protein